MAHPEVLVLEMDKSLFATREAVQCKVPASAAWVLALAPATTVRGGGSGRQHDSGSSRFCNRHSGLLSQAMPNKWQLLRQALWWHRRWKWWRWRVRRWRGWRRWDWRRRWPDALVWTGAIPVPVAQPNSALWAASPYLFLAAIVLATVGVASCCRGYSSARQHGTEASGRRRKQA